MPGFQIPGLGQAKPNEILPPLRPDTLVTAAVAPEPIQQTSRQAEPEAGPELEQGKPSDEGGVPQDNAPEADAPQVDAPQADAPQVDTPQDNAPQDPMAVDQPDSPPSLTHALEAAIGGLAEASPAQPQSQPQQAPGGELQNDQGDNPEWEVDSSPYESSSESSSSDSSDSSGNEGYELLGVEETARLLMEAETRSDDEGEAGGKAASAQVRTKNEMADAVIPKPDVVITPDMKIEELGSVEHMVEGVMLIKAVTPGEYQVLDTGSVLCTADRVVIGAVAETMGKVLQPMYTVRFGSQDDMAELGLDVGAKIFYPIDHAAYVFTQPLKNIRGSDASNIHDEEVGDDEMEFSDDEKEAEHRRSLKNKNKNRARGAADGPRGPRGPHPLRNQVTPDGALNYDDDGPYQPLARPPGYGASAGPSGEPLEPPPRANVHRGGRRGDRGRRGGRGRDSGRGGRRGSHGQPRDGHGQPRDGHGQPRDGHGQPRDGHGQPRDGHAVPLQQQQQQPYASSSWAPVSSAPAPPSQPTFGFQLPSWTQPQFPAPQAPASTLPLAPPPPPPPPAGWPAQGAPGQQPTSGAFVNPAFIAALMSQMQAQRGQQQQPWGGQQQQPWGGQQQ